MCAFIVTDRVHQILSCVTPASLPDLFREGQSIIA